MTQARPSDYWISNSALYIQLNALGDPNYIHANCASGSMVMCFMKGISGLEYDNGHNYKRWTLVANPTVFHDDAVRYVYIAIPKSNAADAVAMVVFPSESIDIYGKNEAGTQIGSTDYYYIFTQGILTAGRVDGVPTQRTWQSYVDTGTLASDQAIAEGGSDSWWEYNATNGMIKFLKTIQEAVFEKLTATWAAITTLVLNNHAITGVAEVDVEGIPDTAVTSSEHLVTPKYGKKKYISRENDDTVNGTITFNNSIIVKGGTVIGEYRKDAQVGIGSAEGINLMPNGTIIARDLELAGSLNVPSIKYNSIEVLAGTRWDSVGKARIREIVSTDDINHTCKVILDLNEGEPGELLEGDILRGFWHNLDGSKNASQNVDDHHGNIQRAGFMSLYCRVTEVADVVERTTDDITIFLAKDDNYEAMEGDITHTAGLVTLAMRQYQEEGETVSYSPYPEKYVVLSVSGSFRTDKPERQKFFVYTTSYIARFGGVNTWEWEDSNFKGGWGDLTGFTMKATTDDGQIITKEFNGEALASGDLYIYGAIDQFTRFSDVVEIILSRADGIVTASESIRADFLLKDVEGNLITSGYTMSITRQSGDDTADAAWNAQMLATYPDGIPSALYFASTDIPASGAVFVVAAQRTVGTQVYTTSSAFTLAHPTIAEVYTMQLSLSPSINADGTLAEGETVQLSATVIDSNGTSVSGFSFDIKRTTDDATSDAAWNASHSMTGNHISLTVSDLGTDNAVFKVTGTISQGGSLYRKVSAQQVITRITKQKLSIDLGRSSETAKAERVNVKLSPRLLSGATDITDKTLDTDWSWAITTNNNEYDIAWANTHKNMRELTLTNADLPVNWQNQSPILFEAICNYRGSEVRTVTSSSRAYPRFRQGETYYLDLDIDMDGSYEASDFSIEVVDGSGRVYDWNFEKVAGKFTLEFQGTVTQSMMLGKYRITLWYHKGKTNQDMVDFDPAFEIVSSTEEI